MTAQDKAQHVEEISSSDITSSFHTSQSSSNILDDIIPPHALAEERPDLFTPGQIDWLVRQRHNNGLEAAGAVLKFGKKIYLNRPKFIGHLMKKAG